MIKTRAEKLIELCAKIPSFSSFEERIHPLILDIIHEINGVESITVNERNLLIKVPGKRLGPPIALSAHLDKINHFGQDFPEILPFRVGDNFLEGQLDDTVGIGLCLSMIRKSDSHSFPDLYLLFSEMEESFGLRHHTHLLRKNGKNIHHGMGAEVLSDYILMHEKLPSIVVTIDTTPLFKGKQGIALYSNPWELNGMTPSKLLVQKTKDITNELFKIYPGLSLSNNTNDYLTYGQKFNGTPDKPIPCLALEPAIFPYHQKQERVFRKDIALTEEILTTFLERYEG